MSYEIEEIWRPPSMLRQQYLPLAHMVRRGDHRMLFHLFHQFGGLVVADAEFALDVAGGTFAVARDDGDGLVVEAVIQPVGA